MKPENINIKEKSDQKTSALRHCTYIKHNKDIHILLVEDNILNQQVALRMLQSEGYSMVVVNNGREALDALKKQYFDLILMDIQMPEMDGIEATQTIRRSKDAAFDPQIPIIALTAHAFREDRETALKAGMDAFISKPFRKYELLKMICYVISNKTLANETKPDESLNNINVVNKAEALERLDADEELLKEIWEIFINDAPRQMDRLKESLDDNDTALAELQAHSLKSTAANIGANLMKSEAFKVELAAKDNNLNDARAHYRKLEHELKKVLNVLTDLQSLSSTL
jgi:CheY-like chemotaxis protein